MLEFRDRLVELNYTEDGAEVNKEVCGEVAWRFQMLKETSPQSPLFTSAKFSVQFNTFNCQMFIENLLKMFQVTADLFCIQTNNDLSINLTNCCQCLNITIKS